MKGTLSKARTTTTNLHPSEIKALRELRSDDSLMILPADKDRTTVVMDKTTYDAKVANMLSDTYKPLPKDPSSALQWKINSLLLFLHKSGHLSDYHYHKLRDQPATSSCPSQDTQARCTTQTHSVLHIIPNILTLHSWVQWLRSLPSMELVVQRVAKI